MASRKALQLIKQAKAGNVAAQRELGCLYLDGGEGLAANAEAASTWLGRAAAAGSVEAALVFGRRLAPASIANPERAIDCYLCAAARGEPNAALWAAQLLLERRGEGDRERALGLLATAAETGLMSAQESLGLVLAEEAGGDAGDSALTWLSRAAAAGSEKAMQRLADAAWARRDAAAIPWLERRARDGDVESAYRLGVLLRYAAGEAGRLERARHWTHVAARAGHVHGLFDLGRIAAGRLPGMGRCNYKLAARCLRRALDGGVADAAVELALLHSYKRFLGRNPELVSQVLDDGARLGSTEAQYRLALSLLKGRNDAEALYRAACWLREAAHARHQFAAAKLERLMPAPPPVPTQVQAYRDQVIETLLPQHEAIAWRLRAMAAFGLRMGEMMFLDPARSDRGFCLVFGLETGVARKVARLVRIAGAGERRLLGEMAVALAAPEAVRGDFCGSYKQRYQKLAWLGRRYGIDWNRFSGKFGGQPPSATDEAMRMCGA